MSAIRKTVSFKNLSDVLSGLGFTDEETANVMEQFSSVTWGNAAYTLIGNNFALNCILDGVPLSYDANQLGNIISRYWELVGQDDFINMEA